MQIIHQDADALRHNKKFADFGDFNTHYSNPNVPKGQLWLNSQLQGADHANAMAKGLKELHDGGEKIPSGMMQKAKQIANRKHVGKDSNIYIQPYQSSKVATPNYQPWIVDGSALRQQGGEFKNFIEGGNPQKYPSIPKNELWIDGSTTKPDEYDHVLDHENTETGLMKKGMSYPKAHKVATNTEYNDKQNWEN